MITITLKKIKKYNPCESGWERLLASKGGDVANINAEFPMMDILDSNGLNDCLWASRCLPEHNNLWRKYAVWCAREVQHLMTQQRSIDALDVARRHSEGLATDEELAAAEGVAWAAAWAAAWPVACAEPQYAAEDAAWAAACAAACVAAQYAAKYAERVDARVDARGAQAAKLREILTSGYWPEDEQ
jgi:hypothetical protein